MHMHGRPQKNFPKIGPIILVMMVTPIVNVDNFGP